MSSLLFASLSSIAAFLSLYKFPFLLHKNTTNFKTKSLIKSSSNKYFISILVNPSFLTLCKTICRPSTSLKQSCSSLWQSSHKVINL